MPGPRTPGCRRGRAVRRRRHVRRFADFCHRRVALAGRAAGDRRRGVALPGRCRRGRAGGATGGLVHRLRDRQSATAAQRSDARRGRDDRRRRRPAGRERPAGSGQPVGPAERRRTAGTGQPGLPVRPLQRSLRRDRREVSVRPERRPRPAAARLRQPSSGPACDLRGAAFGRRALAGSGRRGPRRAPTGRGVTGSSPHGRLHDRPGPCRPVHRRLWRDVRDRRAVGRRRRGTGT